MMSNIFCQTIFTVERMIIYLSEKLFLLQSITVRLHTDILKRKIIIDARNTLANDTTWALRQNRRLKDGKIVSYFMNLMQKKFIIIFFYLNSKISKPSLKVNHIFENKNPIRDVYPLAIS